MTANDLAALKAVFQVCDIGGFGIVPRRYDRENDSRTMERGYCRSVHRRASV
jgi:hypothetical protein